MKLLVLGGTIFLSHAVAAEALQRGHEVICAARGKSGKAPAGAKLIQVDRDVPGSLDPLADERFDAVVDVSRMSYPWVAEALKILGDRTAHWTFVSTINVYSDETTPGQRADAPLRKPITSTAQQQMPEEYGAVKVASENAVREAVGDRSFVVRPGLLTGPGDRSDRFGYWPARFLRGGHVLVPDLPDQPIQHLDVRDLAAWIVDASEQRLIGDFDAVGPRTTLAALLRAIAAEFPPADVVPVPSSALTDAGVQPWAGPKSLPLWLPDRAYWGLPAHDAGPAADAGLRHRPLADTVHGTLETERALGLNRERKAGLTSKEEAELLRITS